MEVLGNINKCLFYWNNIFSYLWGFGILDRNEDHKIICLDTNDGSVNERVVAEYCENDEEIED